MKKKPVKLDFNMALAAFITMAKAKLACMRRDIAEFIKFGITEETVSDAEDLVAEYSEIPTDKELEADQVIATQNKDALKEDLKEAMALILKRAENKFGAESGKFKKFGVTNISELDGGNLLYKASRVYRVGQGYLTDLAGEGLTTVILQDFKTKHGLYDNALSEQEDAISNRDIATEERTEKANQIYHLIVKYCDTGKRIWETRNEAKYNDYVIYDTPPDDSEVTTKAAVDENGKK